MNKEEFLKELENNGFVKDNDPLFKFRKELISEEEIMQTNLDQEDVPCLLYGSTGVNSGFCIYTREHFIWLNVATPNEAVEISTKISAFEAV